MRNHFCFLASFLKRILKKRNQSRENSTSFELLPLEIQETIFSLLPITTLIVCTAVSRSFRSTITSQRFTSSYTRPQTLFRFYFYLNESVHSTYDPDLDRWYSLPLPQFSVRVIHSFSLSISHSIVEHRNKYFSIGPDLYPKTLTTDQGHLFNPSYCLDDDHLFYLSVDGRLVKVDITSGNQECLTNTHPVRSQWHLFGVDKRLFLFGGCRWEYSLLNAPFWEFDFLKKEWNLYCNMPEDMLPDFCRLYIYRIVGKNGLICFVKDDNSIVMCDLLRKKWWTSKSCGRRKVSCREFRQYDRCIALEPSINLVNAAN